VSGLDRMKRAGRPTVRKHTAGTLLDQQRPPILYYTHPRSSSYTCDQQQDRPPNSPPPFFNHPKTKQNKTTPQQTNNPTTPRRHAPGPWRPACAWHAVPTCSCSCAGATCAPARGPALLFRPTRGRPRGRGPWLLGGGGWCVCVWVCLVCWLVGWLWFCWFGVVGWLVGCWSGFGVWLFAWVMLRD
jgi:hypothetical protein